MTTNTVTRTKFINLCPHPIHLVGENGAVVTFAESGTVARVDIRKTKKQVTVEVAEGVYLNMEVTEVEHAEVVGLPEPQEGVIYLVSSYVAQYTKRPDCICPNTDSTAIKDENGKIIGVRGFLTFTQ